jgi:hypothetical protein
MLRRLLLALMVFCVWPFQNHAQENTHNIALEIGAGSMYYNDIDSYGKYADPSISEFTSFGNYSIGLGYYFNMGLLRNYFQFGYRIGSYYYDNPITGSPGEFPDSNVNKGTITQQVVYIQLFNLHFGHDFKWGTISGGPFLRFGLWSHTTSSRKMYYSGYKPDGQGGGERFERTGTMDPLTKVTGLIGLNVLVSYKLTAMQSLFFTGEFSPLGEANTAAHKFYGYQIGLGYMLHF